MFRDAAILGSRLVVGGYLAAHGAQKLVGAFDGPGLDGAGGFFESLGLRPGKPHATAASLAEVGGGLLTAAGLAHPAGPTAIASTMAVAGSTAHRGQGPFAKDGGPELPIAYIAASAALAAAGPGRFSLDRLLGTRLPGKAIAVTAAFGAAGAAAIAGRAIATRRVEARAERDASPQQRSLDDEQQQERLSA